MFEFDWQNLSLRKAAGTLPCEPLRVSPEAVNSVMALHWHEHCLECAPPVCYQTCSLYHARADRKCARFVYGIARAPEMPGLLPYGADLQFRRWGKLESKLRRRTLSPPAHSRMNAIDRGITFAASFLARSLQALSPTRKINGALAHFRDVLLNRWDAQGTPTEFDEFLLVAYTPATEAFRLLLEVWSGDTLTQRTFVTLQPGLNEHRLPGANLLAGIDWDHSRITIYPENDLEVRVVFSWLDFVKWKVRPPQSSLIEAPAPLVKVVAWDLDRTLWSGVLVEDAADSLILKYGVLNLIQELDRRGVLQTVVSKNDHTPAWALLGKLGVQEYFLHPAIHWHPKSASLRQLATTLNLGLNSFAMIDDSAFERAEVSSQLPMVRVYAETEIADLLSKPEMQIPITTMSQQRRAAYQVDAHRQSTLVTFDNDYEAFLSSCQMSMRLFHPTTEEAIERCWELIGRSNQLNLSNRRFTRDAFNELLEQTKTHSIALECQDRFGSYGIAGFVYLNLQGSAPRLEDFVISCRIARKRYEQAFFHWLGQRLELAGYTNLAAALIPTAKNGPLAELLQELGFVGSPTHDANAPLHLPLPLPDLPQWVTISNETTL